MKKAIFLALILILAFEGCATFTQSYRMGNQAEMNRQWEEAVKYYEQAVIENPRESVYRLALLRARVSASLFHLQNARTLLGQGKKEEAAAAYRTALSFDPLNRVVADELKALSAEPAKVEKPAEEVLEPPVKLKVPDEKVQVKFTDTSLRSIFQALGKHGGINFIFDEQFRDVPLTIDLSDRSFEQAIGFLCMASRNFYRTIDERTVIIIPDQPMKRLQYELNAIKTFYLSNNNAQEVANALTMMIRTQFKAPTMMIDKNLNSITVRDTPQALALAEKLLRSWDKAKGEVVIDLEIMEVSRIKMRNLGLDFSESAFGLRYNGPTTDQDTGWSNLNALGLGKSANYQISLPSAFLRFLESDSDTKIIAQPRLRGVGSEDIKYLVGQKVPVPQTTFTPIAAGGVSQQPVVSYNYQDVGIDVKIKPRIHLEGEITMEMEIKITSIGGKGIADIPIITTREVKNVMRLKDGETNLLAGLLKDEERKSLKGIAGIKRIPILGGLFSNSDTQIEQTDVVLTITPYIIRTMPVTAEDKKAIWVDVEGVSGAGGEDMEMMTEEDVTAPEETGEETADEPGQNFVFLNPANFEVPRNREFRLSLDVQTEREIGNMAITIGFNPQVVRLKEVQEGGILRQAGEKVPFLSNIDNSGGGCTVGFSSPAVARGIRGGGVVAILVFEAVGEGETAITVSSVSANAPNGQAIAFESNESRVFVR